MKLTKSAQNTVLRLQIELTKSAQNTVLRLWIELTKSVTISTARRRWRGFKRFSKSINYYALQTSVKVVYYR